MAVAMTVGASDARIERLGQDVIEDDIRQHEQEAHEERRADDPPEHLAGSVEGLAEAHRPAEGPSTEDRRGNDLALDADDEEPGGGHQRADHQVRPDAGVDRNEVGLDAEQHVLEPAEAAL